jgi:uncharacterized protein YcnI
MRVALPLVVVLALLGAARPVRAHVVVQPAESAAGGWQRYTVLVPTEKVSPTVRVEVRLPVGMEIVAVESKPGWTASHSPFPAGAATVQWKGGRIPRGEFLSFEFLAWNPPAARTISWVATQWYEDETSDRWGGEGDEDHASETVLRPAKEGAKDHRRHAH